MKKITVLTSAALIIMAIASSGTWAYFSDSEASQNNTITAGTLDLQVGAEDPCTESIDIGPQLKPGDSGNAADWTSTNQGSISGTLKIAIGSITNDENTLTEPEQAAGDTTDSDSIADDDFESGDGSGGSGWLEAWYLQGNAEVTTDGTSHGGSYHLRLTSSNGYADRALDLSGYSNVHLQFWAKADSFETDEFAECSVYDGTGWDVVQTWLEGDADNTYHFYDIDLSGYTMASEFYIAFDAQMSDTDDYLYIDDLVLLVPSGGELGDFVDMAVWLDMNRSGGWDSGDMYLKSDGTVVNWASGSSVPPEAYDAINSYAGVDWESTDGMPTMSGAGDLDFMVDYDFPVDANDDQAQDDNCVFDITFTLEQETS
jgi:predicted ribosomally synthesized peptide with SipW-like signal peptide